MNDPRIRMVKFARFRPKQRRMPAMQDLWQNLVKQFTATFITEQRYMLFLNGLKTTLTITFLSLIHI